MRAADERVDDASRVCRAEPVGREAGAGSEAARPRGGVLERARDGRAERDDAIAASLRAAIAATVAAGRR